MFDGEGKNSERVVVDQALPAETIVGAGLTAPLDR